ncbi:hypothetical protein Ocin01_17805 [Orchesella cincta]|uniref:Transmembrane protein n=1 Tax=Orchesella cincta TaxID=48709 RepID=A0A1D2M7B6_ORCCI|nr:hypothetical protein Ocin01_17805 [Orchesella cincta]
MNPCTRFWKITGIILAIIIIALGLYSYIESDWRIANQHEDPCQQNVLNIYGRKDKWCPPISIEEYFVAINIICLLVSLISFWYTKCLEKPSYIMKKVDIFYHWLAALLLLIAGILFIASAITVLTMHLMIGRRELNMRTIEKVIAGALTIIQALVYCSIGFFLGRRE